MSKRDLLVEEIENTKKNRYSNIFLDNLNLTEFPTELIKIKWLKEISIKNNNIKTIPDSIVELKNLKKINLIGNPVEKIPNISGIIIDYNIYLNIRSSITRESIIGLKLDDRKFIPVLNKFVNLEFLDLTKCKLSHLHSSIMQLTKLKYLDLSSNGIEKINEEILNLKLLETINLSNNKLKYIPEEISELTCLTDINFSQNNISFISKSLLKLSKLEYLRIAYNKFTKFPEVLLNFDILKLLWITGNKINMIPDEINNLKLLYNLDVGKCNLNYIPKSITELSNLRLVGFWDNNLIGLPINFDNLLNLEVLDLEKNNLREFPKSILKLKNLKKLDLSNNKISEIPYSIIGLEKLRTLDIENNPLISPPIELVKRGYPAIKNYFKELVKGVDFIYEIKLILVGEPRAGKTSLTKTLSDVNYVFELGKEESTQGIGVNRWQIKKEEFIQDGKKIPKDFQLNIWDFGGQEIYHSTHQFFLTRRSLYILVDEARKDTSHENFYYWLNIIQLLGDKSPVVIVINKCDQPTKELPIKEYKENFPHIQEIHKISCAKGYEYTINDLKRTIKKIILDKSLLDHVGSPIPKDWVKLRNGLENQRLMGKDFISYPNYLLAAKNLNMGEKKALELSQYFHDIGIILHFQDDPTLRGTIFLNHEWITKGVYKVIDDKNIKSKFGRFTDDDLMNIWSEGEWQHKTAELLSLMKKFDLCYEISKGQYLSPHLLLPDEYKYKWRTMEDNIRFEYHYSFMPKGIISRLIVKLNKYNFEDVYWLHGVLLEHEQTRAIVKEDFFKRKLNLRLEGPFKEQFLFIILVMLKK